MQSRSDHIFSAHRATSLFPRRRTRPPALAASLLPRRRARLAALAALVCLPLLAGCDPSIAEDFSFVAQQTTNQDFEAPVLISVGNAPITFTGVDLDNDGGTDVVVVNRLETVASSSQAADVDAPGTITVLRNDGAGGLTFASEFSVGVLPGRVAAGDLNGDGFDDLALLNDSARSVTIFFNDGSGAFPTQQSFTFGGPALQFELVDLTNVGNLDVLISVPSVDDSLEPGFMVSLVNGGSGNFTQKIIAVGNAGRSPAPARFVTGNWNGDLPPDVALIDSRNSSVITLTGTGIGDGTFAVVTHGSGEEFVTVGTAPFHIVSEDFNSDGNLDLAVSNRLTATISILPGQGNGKFLQDDIAEPLVEGSGRPERLLTGAFSATGVDIVVVQRTGGKITFLDGDGGGAFAAGSLSLDGDPFAIACGDFNKDTHLDFVTAESTRRLLSVFAGGGDATFERTVVGFDTSTTSPKVLDLSGPGSSDLLVLQPNSDQLVVLLNRHPGAGTACP